MKIASYNIRKCIGLDRQRNPQRVLSIIDDLSVDVIALQEADKRLGQRPTSIPFDEIRRKTNMKPVSMDKTAQSLGWHGNSILINKHANAENVEDITLPGLEPRGALMADVHVKNGNPIRIVAIHLGLLRKSRIKQLDHLQNLLAKKKTLPTIIMGDFNEWSLKKGMEPISDSFSILSPGKSFHSAIPMAQLDRFAYSNDLTVNDAGVYEKKVAKIASDHLPVWADISIH
ncbi:metal-dependent hydrolase [Amylibacter sp. SFDW26]|uniref:endonuclease/exonuclease/phosphatase family protein n=1 Tax=Amylibacter sp. SFDW26 TaxID=2652722 RepID=UPI0012617F8F|nr:endonuclease/exonuclease/phosphatase family protein [Amylibacter sp. SFDW26]KAB7614431.1 metal-dependent hydrolase [Amylibacter sp. SFDW26]